MKPITRVTNKGQVVIPKKVREQLRWASGTQLAVEIMGDGAVRLTPLETEDAIDTLDGCLKDLPQDPLKDLEAEHRAELSAKILTLAEASLSDVPAGELCLLARRLQEPESWTDGARARRLSRY
ncbi:MAG TPA: AbrB/MazE/SpoVT family DNA-binding domain-containing protein [Thermoanaerobaculia bacterium]|nr:AbrB/MazE/SpoVT family DNA-binding domain-containing protein [Thermoanaerobaculia bacterium]